MSRWFWAILIAGVVASQAFLWLTPLPLGIPNEWAWTRVAVESDVVWNLGGLVVAAILYVLFIQNGYQRFHSKLVSGRLETTGWMIGLVVASFLWLWVVQEAAPSRNRIGKATFVLYYDGSSGYFSKARYESPDAAAFLAGYEQLMRQGDVLHVGTHPPGLFLVFHGLIAICQNPVLSVVLDSTQPASFRETCDIVAANSTRSAPPRPLLPADRRVLWLATLLVMVAASLVVVPLFHLARQTNDVAVAWWTAALWPAVPAVAIFVPKSDVAYAFLGMLLTWTWLAALRRRSIVLSLATGLVTWCGLMLSLAFLPIILFSGIVGWKLPSTAQTQTSPIRTDSSDWKFRIWGDVCLKCLVAALAGFLIPTLLLRWFGQVDLLAIWKWNYQNHAGFYQLYSRTYWKWLFVNPIELTFAVGWPVAMLAACSIRSSLFERSSRLRIVAIAVVIVLGSLWLTGKNSGEAARLWIAFMPWLVWLAGSQIASAPSNSANHRPTVLLALQIVAGALTVARVNGFQL